MSNRMVRINSLILQEVSLILHTEFKTEAVSITVTSVDIAPDLRSGRIFYSVIGDEGEIRLAERFLKKVSPRIRFLLGSKIDLKYIPFLTYHFDPSFERGSNILSILDEIENKPKTDADA